MSKVYEVANKAANDSKYFNALKDAYELLSEEGFGMQKFRDLIEGVEKINKGKDE